MSERGRAASWASSAWGRPVLAKVREALRIVGFSATFAVVALVANLVVLLVFFMTAGSLDEVGSPLSYTAVDELAEAFDAAGTPDETPQLPKGTIRELRDADQWAMLVDDAGQVAWSLDLPEDVPTTYTMRDVATFTRWYLRDYPVVTRVCAPGLLVVGAPKGSEWKYSYSTNMGTMVLFLGLFVMLFVTNMVVAIALARAYARRSWAERDHARTEWVAAVSHDVRTPLAVALADADTLAHDAALDHRQRARAERVVGRVEEVSSLVADLNVANRLSYAMEPVEARPVALAPIVRSVAAEALNDDAAGAHPIDVELGEDVEEIMVRGDAALFRRMLVNLVGNSVRHNPEGCSIRIALSRLPARPLRRRQCLLVVEDDGRGLGQDLLETLRRAPSTELPEHGLGLVIVRRIAHACGGQVRFMEPEGAPTGTRCEVRLPLA